ncbi:hypothetical protein OIY81_1447 [Cryptosporidium canis]|nr:hypothetical protein OIY81_1447 [Cryptosporidium canis]
MWVELGGIVFELDHQVKVISKRREAVLEVVAGFIDFVSKRREDMICLKVGYLIRSMIIFVDEEADEVKAEIDVLGELLFLGRPGGNEQGGLNVGERGPKVADGAEGEEVLDGAQGDDECSDQTAGVSEQGGIGGVLDGAELGLSEILNKLGPR